MGSSRPRRRRTSMSVNPRSGCGPAPAPPSRRSHALMATPRSTRRTAVALLAPSAITARQAGSGVAAMKSAYVSCSGVPKAMWAEHRRRVASTVVMRWANDSATTDKARRLSALSRSGRRGSKARGSCRVRFTRRSTLGAPISAIAVKIGTHSADLSVTTRTTCPTRSLRETQGRGGGAGAVLLHDEGGEEHVDDLAAVGALDLLGQLALDPLASRRIVQLRHGVA